MKPKILIVFYSASGNTAKLAEALLIGAREAGAEVRLRQVQELLPRENWSDKMKMVRRRLNKIPIANNEDLIWADGIAFGSPTRYGNLSSQLKHFIDLTGKLWMDGKLINKVGTLFTSVSTQHGGHETTILTGIVPLLHHGMIVMGIPYSEKGLMNTTQVSGGSPYGASSVSGPMSNIGPNENELEIAISQGRRLAELSKKMVA